MRVKQAGPERLSRFWMNPGVRTHYGRVGIASLRPKPSKRKTQATAIPRKPSRHAYLPTWKSSQEPGSALGAFRELRMKAHSLYVKLVINLGCSEPVTHSRPLALGIVSELGSRRRRPRAADGKCECWRLWDVSEWAG